jgi:hypothetical protein
MQMRNFLIWSQEHGDVYVFAPDVEQALDAFYEQYSGNGDYEVVVHTLNEEGEIDE